MVGHLGNQETLVVAGVMDIEAVVVAEIMDLVEATLVAEISSMLEVVEVEVGLVVGDKTMVMEVAMVVEIMDSAVVEVTGMTFQVVGVAEEEELVGLVDGDDTKGRITFAVWMDINDMKAERENIGVEAGGITEVQAGVGAEAEVGLAAVVEAGVEVGAGALVGGRSRSRSNSYNRHEIRTERTEPVHKTNIIPPASGTNSSKRTSDAKDVLPSSVPQMIPAEDCETYPSQQVKHELLTPNLDQDEEMRRCLRIGSIMLVVIMELINELLKDLSGDCGILGPLILLRSWGFLFFFPYHILDVIQWPKIPNLPPACIVFPRIITSLGGKSGIGLYRRPYYHGYIEYKFFE